jgi:hypothetical protein
MRDMKRTMIEIRENTERIRAEREAAAMDEPGKVGGVWASEAPLSAQEEQDATLGSPEPNLCTCGPASRDYCRCNEPEDAPDLIEGPDPLGFLQEIGRADALKTLINDGVRTAYLAGPMRGYVAYNYPLFNTVAKCLRWWGLTIENPAESDAEVHERAIASKHPLSVYMERDLADVAKTEVVLVLPGWEASEGATIEVTVAWMLGHPVYSLPDFVLVPKFFTEKPASVESLLTAEDFAIIAEESRTAPLTPLPTDPEARKGIPVVTGVLDYFPAALAEVAKVSKAGNDQHNPGEPLHWARGKSMDQADTCVRHLMERGGIDVDGMRHSAKAAWRALAVLQIELEEAGEAPLARGAS